MEGAVDPRMIDTSKMEFVEKPAERSPLVLVKGRLQILTENIVDRNANVTMDFIKERMREEVWWYAYHDLIDPLTRLQSLAKIYVPYEYQQEVLVHCEKLNALLAFKK